MIVFIVIIALIVGGFIGHWTREASDHHRNRQRAATKPEQTPRNRKWRQ